MEKDVFIEWDKEAEKEFLELQKLVEKGTPSRKKPTYAQLLSSINIALRNISLDHNYGNLIHLSRISKQTAKKYGTYKIWRVNLVGYWRLLYTIIGSKVKIIAFILEYIDHKKYNKLFGYDKR